MENSVMIHNVSPDEFYEKMRTTIREEMYKQKSAPKVEEKKLLTRKETAKRLRISLPTLNTYTKYGTLKGVRFGYRVLYREEDVELALKEIPNRRFKTTR